MTERSRREKRLKDEPIAESLADGFGFGFGVDHYLDGLSLATGWLVIFDQRSGLPDLSKRTTTEVATTPSARTVTVIRG